MPTKSGLTLSERAFNAACEAGDLAAGVALARSVVKAAFRSHQLDDEALQLTHLLTEHLERPAGMTQDIWEYHCQVVFGAVAMGVALGQLTSPDMFAKEGGRS